MNREPGDGITLRDGRIEDADEVEAVHYASREAGYSEWVADWPPICSAFGFTLDGASKVAEGTSEDLVALRYRIQL